jgi:DNA-directed RNA polymerase specialized sigma24 family protein
MPELTFDEAYPVARALARLKALSVVGCCGLCQADCEDIESDLLLDFYLRFSKFDRQRASVRTFAARVMDKKLKSILRQRGARCRAGQNGQASLDDLPFDCTTAPPTAGRQQFWLDVGRALATLPPGARLVAQALCWDSPAEVGRSLGRSRSRIYQRIEQLRTAFLAAGIGPDYFAASGIAQ